MIDLIKIDADHVLAVRVHQNLLDSDIELAMNFLEKKVRTRDHIALYAEIDDVADIDPGIVMKELRHGVTQVKELRSIDRVAIVSDNPAVRSIDAVSALVPTIEIKTFGTAEAAAAKTWISKPLPV